MIEVESRAFISEEKYNELLAYFDNNATFKGTQRQITNYFDCSQDLRLMITDDDYCQLWLKKGKIHDDAREELIVKIEKAYKDILLKMLSEIGLGIQIKWYRIRNSFEWDELKVDIDYTHGYGYIIELETLVDDASKVDSAKNHLNMVFNKLGIEITPKEIFNQRYVDYEKNWTAYTKDIDENKFLQ